MKTSLTEEYKKKIIWLILSLMLTTTILTGCVLPSASDKEISPGSDISLTMANQSTPEEAVLSFYAAMDGGDIDMMTALIEADDESSNLFLEGLAMNVEQGVHGYTTDIEIYTVEETDNVARVRSYFYERMYKKNELLWEGSNGDWFTLVEKDDKWYFIGLADPIPPGWIIER